MHSAGPNNKQQYASRYLEFDMHTLTLPERHQLLLSAVAPRPIALTGTIDAQGRCNLAPFSYFNAFGANPVFIAISPAFSGKNANPKDTYLNILETKEFTVSIVNYALIERANLTSFPFSRGVDEFEKSGLTKLPSLKIKPPGVAESPCVLECRFLKCIALGRKAGSGNLMIGEVIHMRFQKDVFDAKGQVDPHKIDQVARLGYDWYTRAREGLFELPKPKAEDVGEVADLKASGKGSA